MTEYKLIYFNARGRAELIRWIFKITGVEFEDFRIPKGGWVEYKPKTPFGQVPVLEIDGKAYCQGVDISRYLATKHGLNEDSLEDKAHADMIVDCCVDLGEKATAIFLETDTGVKDELAKKFREELPKFMEYFQNMLKQNKGGDGWFVGDKMTWADLAFVLYTTSWMEPINIDPCWDDYTLLKALKEKVEALPQLQDWFNVRPKTRF